LSSRLGFDCKEHSVFVLGKSGGVDMLRTLTLTILSTVFLSLNVYGAGHITCEKMDDFMKNVSMDEDLSEEQKGHLTGELQKADAMCKEGKTEDAEMLLKQANDEWARTYFSDMMDSGH
jgi:hypothetical protein